MSRGRPQGDYGQPTPDSWSDSYGSGDDDRWDVDELYGSEGQDDWAPPGPAAGDRPGRPAEAEPGRRRGG